MSNLTEYLLELAADPDRCAQFKADPKPELQHLTLTSREKDALMARDPQAISAALSESSRESGLVVQLLFALFQQTGK